MTELAIGRDQEQLEPGTRVRVRTAFDGSWADGFEIVDRHGLGERQQYVVRRLTDGWQLPSTFTVDQLQREW